MEKNCHVSYTFNQFYEEGYLEFAVSENMSRFFLFLKYIKILFDKFLNIDVSTKVVITHFSSTIMTLTCILAVKGVSTPPLFFRFSTVDFRPRSSACHSDIMCNMIVHAYTQNDLLGNEVRGEEVS